MTPRLSALSLAPLLAASTAYAQSPGETYYGPAPQPQYAQPPPGYSQPGYAQPPGYYSQPGYAQPPQDAAPAPAPADPCASGAPQVSWQAQRWAIGLSFGSMSVSPDDAPEGYESKFRVGQISVRYRASRRLELELAMSGGREVLEDDTEGDLATGSVTLALRYRFRPERRWNWYLMAGLGGAVVAPHESTEAERSAAQRPLGMAGIGIERRFRRFALNAELRGIGLGPREDAMGEDAPVPVGPSMPATPTAPRLPSASAATVYAEELGGGMITIGASYYF